ncbi:MAG TPA: phage minor capsid protein, partial [Mycobacteriales bacterium]
EQTPGFAAVEALATAVHQDVGVRSSNVLRNVLDAFREVQAAGAARVLTGVQTRRQASQAMWTRLTRDGIMSFVDRAGRRWQLSTYVEMAGRTVAQRAAVQGQTDRLDAIGHDLVIVSDAPQECPICRPFEGKVLSLGGRTGTIQVEHAIHDGQMVTVPVVDTLEGARRKGFQHPQCRHSVSVYLPGVTRAPTHTADPEGDKARQQQRALERRIRSAKVAEAAAMTPEAKTAARRRIRQAQADLRAHLAAHPRLKRLPYRESIGAGNIPRPGHDDAAGRVGPDVQTTLDGADEALGRRQADTTAPVDGPDLRTPVAGQASLDDVTPDETVGDDLTALSDDDLQTAMAAALAEGDFDRFGELSTEADRRDAADQAARDAEAAAEAKRAADRERRQKAKEAEEERQYAELERLIEGGMSEEEAVAEALGISVDRQRRDRAIQALRGAGFTGRNLDELARQSYRDHIAKAVVEAEGATRGNMLTREGELAGIDPISLFSGTEARARRYASPELREWWDDNGRPTFEEWKTGLLGDGGALRRIRGARGDFLT